MKNSLLITGKRIKATTGIISLFLTILLFVQFNISNAQVPGTATVYPPTGGFGIDGNLNATGTVGDWLQGTGGAGSFVVNPDGSPVNPIMTFHLTDAYAPSVDNVFKGGKIYDNPNNMIWEMQNANGKSDMNHAFLHLTSDNTGAEWAVFSSDRKSASGVSYLDFEFLQNSVVKNPNGTFTSNGPDGGRTVGDFIVTANFGNGSTTFQVWTWQQSTPGNFSYVEFTGDLTGIAFAAENLGSLPSTYPVFGNPAYAANTYVEGAMNLSGFIGVALPCTNTAINTIFIKTKTSPSLEATIQDFIDPIQVQALTIGTANAGVDQTLCDEGEFTAFTMSGEAHPVMGYWVSSINWSVVSYTGSQAPTFSDPNSLTTQVNVYDGTATVRLTVITTDGTDLCEVYDDVYLTVNPKPASTWIDPPADITVACAAAGSIVPSYLSFSNGVTGQCASSGTVLGVITGSYDECGGTLVQSWTYTDPWGNTINHSQTITVTPAPVAAFVNPPANITFTCDAANSFVATSLTYTNSGLGGCLIQGAVTGIITGSYTECGGTLYETWTFVDDCNRQIQHVQTINVLPAPQAQFAPIAPVTITCDAATTFAASNLGYTNSGLGGCLIEGQVMGTLVYDYTECGGTITQSWTFTDNCDRTSTQTQIITVTPAPMAAFVNPPATATITCDAATTFAATDLTYTNSGLGGCLISGQVPGVITGSYTECGGTLYETWTFVDDCNRQIQHVQTINVLPAPQAQFAPIAPVTITCDAATTFAASNLGYTNSGLGGCLIEGQVMGTLVYDYTECGGTITQSWTFTDNCDRTSTQTQIITVTPAPMAAFVNPPATATITCDAATTFAATDLTYTNSGLGGCLISGQVPGVITGSYTECGGTLYETWTFVDDCNRQIQHVQTINVLPAPQAQFAPIAPVTITCDAATTFAASNLGYTNSGLGGCLIEGQVMGTLVYDYTECGGTITQSWTFTDNCDRTSTQTQIITVTPAPMAAFVNPPATATITCDAATTFAATDLTYTNSGLGGCLISGQVPGVITGSYTECGGTLYETWTFVDDCNRQIQHVQTINVLPAPQAQFAPIAPVTITCDAATTFAASNLGYTNSGLGGCLIEGQVMGTLVYDYTECGGTITQSWTFTDNCDRTSTQTQIITVTPAPMAAFVNPPATATITCDAATTFAATDLTYTNSGLGGCLISGQVPGVITGSYTECGGTLYETWTFVDDCNRQIQHVQTINVLPAPQAQFAPIAPVTITCDAATTFAASNLGYTNSGLGGCLIEGQVMGTLVYDYTECGGTITQSWTFTDNCDRTSTQTQIITVTPAPMAAFANPPATATITCDAATTIAVTNLAYTNNGLGGCIIEGEVLGVITGDYTECGGTLYQTWTFVDDCNRQIQHIQTINVLPAPQAQFATVENYSISCENVPALQPSYLHYTNSGLEGCEISGDVLGVITGDFNNCNGVLTQTWTFTDDCGRTIVQTQTINIYDETAPTFTAPANTTIYTDIDCNYNSSVEVTGDVINESDNCSTGLQATYADVVSDGICAGSKIIYRTWSLVDDCGNAAADQLQVIAVEDNTSPEVITLTGSLDVILECSDPAGLEAALALIPSATDNCSTELTLNLIGDVTTNSELCDNEYTRVRTWNFTDDCGNISSNFVQTITVVDNTNPVWTVVPADMTVECDGQGNTYQLTTWLNSFYGTDNCGTATPTNNFSGLSDLCGLTGSATVTFTLTDECGNITTANATFTIVDSQAPVFTYVPADVTVNCNTIPEVGTPVATDACSTSVTINYLGEVRTDGNCTDTYTLTRTWTATDDCGNVATATQVINVQDITAPEFTYVPANVTVECDAVPEVGTPTATDLCDTEVSVAYQGEVRADGNCANNYTLTRTWTATDNCGNVATATQVINVVDTTIPVFTVTPQDLTVECNGSGNTTQLNNWLAGVAATDNCGTVNITNNYTTLSNGCGNTGSATVTFTATDACGNFATTTATFSIIDTEDPSLVVPNDMEVDTDPGVCGAQLTLIATADDDCGNVTITNNITGTANASGFYPSGLTTIYWTATDECGNVTTDVTTIMVNDDEPPMIICPPHMTVNADPTTCGAYINVPAPIVNDNCEIRTITNTYTHTDDASAVYPVGTTIVWWTVVDMAGNTDNCFMNITVIDNIDPVIECPENIITSNDPGLCETNVTVPEPVVTDNCPNTTVVNSYTGTSNASGVYPVGTTTVIWTVTDASGNTASCTMTVTVNDTETPIIICPENITVTNDPGVCGANVTVPQPEFYDNCDVNELSNDFNNTSNATGFYPVGTTTITWTVTDIHGNEATCQMTVTVTDAENPTIICPTNITVSNDPGVCGATVEVPSPESADNCGVAMVSNDFTGTGNASGLYPVGVTTVLWTVTDIHGNTATCEMTVTVTDDEAPAVTCPGDVTVVAGADCQATVEIPEPVVTDNCEGVTYVNNITNTGNASGVYPVGETTVTWTVTDSHGNTSTCSITVTVTAPPVAVDDNATTDINTAVIIDVLANDTDCADGLVPSTVINTSNPANGTVVVNPADGSFTYTPNTDFTGTDSFTYTVCNAQGVCDEALVTITITGEVPVVKLIAVDDEYSTEFNQSREVTNLENDIYPETVTPVVTILEQPKYGTITVHGDMTATYTPNMDYSGTDTFTYILSDLNGVAKADTALTTITIVPAPERDTITIWNIITPDNDGRNDRWIIDNIQEYPDNEILIFNRWGDQVRYFEHYDNTTVVWDGTNKQGNMLPAATYYYIVKLRDIQKIYTGWIVVHTKE
jgi:gliding motility-associated-like protein